MTEPSDVSSPDLRVDHLVYATPRLDAGVEEIRTRLGIDPLPGGRHPRWRTRNALVGLGPTTYLEIIGPDEEPEGIVEPDEVESPRPFGIDALTSPRLMSWAARATPLESAIEAARLSGFDPGPVMAGHRETSDGTVLRWLLTDPTAERDGGVLPFLIDWGDSPHPAASLNHGCHLRELRIRHPDPDGIRRFLRSLHRRVVVEAGPEPVLSASIQAPSRTVRFE